MSETPPWPPNEMAELLDALAQSADRNSNSHSETAHLSRHGAETIKRLLATQHEMLIWLRRNASAESEVNMRAAFLEAHNACLAIAEGRAYQQVAPETKR